MIYVHVRNLEHFSTLPALCSALPYGTWSVVAFPELPNGDWSREAVLEGDNRFVFSSHIAPILNDKNVLYNEISEEYAVALGKEDSS